MRGFLASLFLVGAIGGAAAIGYQAGVSSAVSTAAAGGAAVAYGGGWHLIGGLLLLPFTFLLIPLMFFGFVAFLSFAFGGRRHRRWSGDDAMGMRGGWDRMGRHDARREWVAEQHRRLHENDAARAAGTSGQAGSAGATGA